MVRVVEVPVDTLHDIPTFSSSFEEDGSDGSSDGLVWEDALVVSVSTSLLPLSSWGSSSAVRGSISAGVGSEMDTMVGRLLFSLPCLRVSQCGGGVGGRKGECREAARVASCVLHVRCPVCEDVTVVVVGGPLGLLVMAC